MQKALSCPFLSANSCLLLFHNGAPPSFDHSSSPYSRPSLRNNLTQIWGHTAIWYVRRAFKYVVFHVTDNFHLYFIYFQIESYLAKSDTGWLARGDHPTSADFMMLFPLEILVLHLPFCGPKAKEYVERIHQRLVLESHYPTGADRSSR